MNRRYRLRLVRAALVTRTAIVVARCAAFIAGRAAVARAWRGASGPEAGPSQGALRRILNNAKPIGPLCAPDIAPPGGDGLVNVDDLLAVINAWGPCR